MATTTVTIEGGCGCCCGGGICCNACGGSIPDEVYLSLSKAAITHADFSYCDEPLNLSTFECDGNTVNLFSFLEAAGKFTLYPISKYDASDLCCRWYGTTSEYTLPETLYRYDSFFGSVPVTTVTFAAGLAPKVPTGNCIYNVMLDTSSSLAPGFFNCGDDTYGNQLAEITWNCTTTGSVDAKYTAGYALPLDGTGTITVSALGAPRTACDCDLPCEDEILDYLNNTGDLKFTFTTGGTDYTTAIGAITYTIGTPHYSPWLVIPDGTARTGVLTARTDFDTGTITMDDSGHGITTGQTLAVWWSTFGDGQIRGMTVGTVSGKSVPIDGGTGSPLPDVGTAVTVADAIRFTARWGLLANVDEITSQCIYKGWSLIWENWPTAPAINMGITPDDPNPNSVLLSQSCPPIEFAVDVLDGSFVSIVSGTAVIDYP
jgi:hypothetical protein